MKHIALAVAACAAVFAPSISSADESYGEMEQATAPGKWMPAVVPGTVLNTLVKNGVVPDPYYGLNNTSAISPRGKTSDKH